MARTQSAGLLDLTQFMQGPRGGLFPSDAELQQMPARPMQMASADEGGVVQYLQLPTLADAQEALMRARQQGFNGYIDPYGSDRNGHEVRIWKDPNLPSLGPARGK